MLHVVFELLLNVDIGELLDGFLSSPSSSPCQACVASPGVQTPTNWGLVGIGGCKLHTSSSASLALEREAVVWEVTCWEGIEVVAEPFNSF